MSTSLYQPTGIEAYLEQREAKSDFVVVEFGHRGEPICLNQLDYYRGGRAYIGVEANLRDPIGVAGAHLDKKVAELRGESNWFFLEVCRNAMVEHVEGSPQYSYVYGDYDSQSILPDQSADEIFLGNVLCDPMISYNDFALESLVREIRRVASPETTIISRSTTSPHRLRLDAISLLGMDVAHSIAIEQDPEMIEKLEGIYGTTEKARPGSVYNFFELKGQDVAVEEDVVAEGAE